MEPGLAAHCLLAALGREDQDFGPEFERTYVGALIILDAIEELKRIRKLLTAQE